MKISRLSRNRAILLICDIQEKFIPHTYQNEGMIEAAVMALKVANLFNLPVLATQHNPKAFGKIVAPLAASLPEGHHLFEKTTFSMINEHTESALKNYPDRNQVILIGAETHVCVLQTFLDLINRNYEVYLPLDAITSIRTWERSIAIQRMQSQGATLTSVESAAFEMLGDFKDQNGRPLFKLIKQLGPREKAISHL